MQALSGQAFPHAALQGVGGYYTKMCNNSELKNFVNTAQVQAL